MRRPGRDHGLVAAPERARLASGEQLHRAGQQLQPLLLVAVNVHGRLAVPAGIQSSARSSPPPVWSAVRCQRIRASAGIARDGDGAAAGRHRGIPARDPDG